MFLTCFSVEPSSILVEPASTTSVTVRLGASPNSPGVAFYRVTEKSGKFCQARASATPIKCDISSLPAGALQSVEAVACVSREVCGMAIEGSGYTLPESKVIFTLTPC